MTFDLSASRSKNSLIGGAFQLMVSEFQKIEEEISMFGASKEKLENLKQTVDDKLEKLISTKAKLQESLEQVKGQLSSTEVNKDSKLPDSENGNNVTTVLTGTDVGVSRVSATNVSLSGKAIEDIQRQIDSMAEAIQQLQATQPTSIAVLTTENVANHEGGMIDTSEAVKKWLLESKTVPDKIVSDADFDASTIDKQQLIQAEASSDESQLIQGSSIVDNDNGELIEAVPNANEEQPEVQGEATSERRQSATSSAVPWPTSEHPEKNNVQRNDLLHTSYEEFMEYLHTRAKTAGNSKLGLPTIPDSSNKSNSPDSLSPKPNTVPLLPSPYAESLRVLRSQKLMSSKMSELEKFRLHQATHSHQHPRHRKQGNQQNNTKRSSATELSRLLARASSAYLKKLTKLPAWMTSTAEDRASNRFRNRTVLDSLRIASNSKTPKAFASNVFRTKSGSKPDLPVAQKSQSDSIQTNWSSNKSSQGHVIPHSGRPIDKRWLEKPMVPKEVYLKYGNFSKMTTKTKPEHGTGKICPVPKNLPRQLSFSSLNATIFTNPDRDLDPQTHRDLGQSSSKRSYTVAVTTSPEVTSFSSTSKRPTQN